MGKEFKFTREEYKKIKRLDHKQMERFLVKVYTNGFEDGRKEGKQTITLSALSAAIMKIRGIGEKKASEVVAVVNQMLKGEDINVN